MNQISLPLAAGCAKRGKLYVHISEHAHTEPVFRSLDVLHAAALLKIDGYGF